MGIVSAIKMCWECYKGFSVDSPDTNESPSYCPFCGSQDIGDNDSDS